MSTLEEPKIIKGGLACDDRGELRFVNEFDFNGVKRFYSVRNHHRGFVRAWHGHKHEQKFVYCTVGAALVCAVKIDNWDNPSKNAKVFRYTLSEKQPAILIVPPGHVNGFMSLTDDCLMTFFSDANIEQSAQDDIRFDARYWNPWKVEER